MSNYLTVKEFAEATGMTTQRIYQRMNGDLKQFTKLVNGKKRLSIEGLRLFDSISVNSNNEKLPNLPNGETQPQEEIGKYKAENIILHDENTALKAENSALKADLANLQNLVNELDKVKVECKSLDILVQELRADKATLNSRLDKAEADRTELITNNKELTIALKAAQALHGMDKHQSVIEVDATMEQQQSQPQTETPQELQRKPSFFQRLFRKRSE